MFSFNCLNLRTKTSAILLFLSQIDEKGRQIEKIFGEKEVHRLFELSIDQSVWINIHFVFALKTDGHTGVRSRISDLIRYTTKGFILSVINTALLL